MARNLSDQQASTAESPTLQPELQKDDISAAGDALGAVEQVATSLADDAKQAARAAYRAVREQGTEFASDVGHELGKTANAQKDRGVEAMTGFVRAFQSVAGDLESQSPKVAQYVRDAASKVETLTQNVGKRDVTELMKAATDLARSQPALFFGGAVAAGFLLSRVLKSSGADTTSRGHGAASSDFGGQSSGQGGIYSGQSGAYAGQGEVSLVQGSASSSSSVYQPGENSFDMGKSGRSEKVGS